MVIISAACLSYDRHRVLRYIINIRKVHSLEVVIYIRMKMHGKHSIKKNTVISLLGQRVSAFMERRYDAL